MRDPSCAYTNGGKESAIYGPEPLGSYAFQASTSKYSSVVESQPERGVSKLAGGGISSRGPLLEGLGSVGLYENVVLGSVASPTCGTLVCL